MAQQAEITVAKRSLTSCVWAHVQIGSHTMPGQQHSQPTLISLGQGCMRVYIKRYKLQSCTIPGCTSWMWILSCCRGETLPATGHGCEHTQTISKGSIVFLHIVHHGCDYIHAIWKLLQKRRRCGNSNSIWAGTLTKTLIYLIMGVWALTRYSVSVSRQHKAKVKTLLILYQI